MTGLIYLAIVALWAAVLVPMWLRRHDQANEARTADRFNTAMRTLSRRPVPYGDHRELLMPRRRHHVEVTVTGARGRVTDKHPPTPRPAPVRPSRADRARARAAVRRRRVLLLVGVLLTIVAVGVLRGLLPLVVLVVPVLAGGAVLLAGVPRPERAASRRTTRDVRDRRPVRTDRPAAARRVPRPATAESGAEPALVPAAYTAAEEPYDAVLDGAWDPVETTLPTYVTKPRASGVPRYIDLRSPGAWDSAAMLEQARTQRRPATDADLGLDAVGMADADAEVAAYADPFFDQEQDQPRRRAAGA
ncbi:MAG: hypothetical protein R2737_03540 [Candidatus Nanopelagicales bacterium]